MVLELSFGEMKLIQLDFSNIFTKINRNAKRNNYIPSTWINSTRFIRSGKNIQEKYPEEIEDIELIKMEIIFLKSINILMNFMKIKLHF